MPGALHFSGHGVTKDDVKAELLAVKKFTMMSDDEIEQTYQKGDALVIEDNNCMGKYLFADDLKLYIDRSGVRLNFVFIAACHSQFAAEIFLKAGS
jgi:hypothetical protein